MLRTALLCAALAIGGYAGAAWLTHDFQAWTAEGARRLEVALAPVARLATRRVHADRWTASLATFTWSESVGHADAELRRLFV